MQLDKEELSEHESVEECKQCAHHEKELFMLRYERGLYEREQEQAKERVTQYMANENELGFLNQTIPLPYHTNMYRKNCFVDYYNAHEKSNKNYINDMFNYLGYALFVVIGKDKEYYNWCTNGGYNRSTSDDPIARDVYYLLKYLKETKLPDNPYVNNLMDCRNAIAHWTDQRDYFHSFQELKSLERENSCLDEEEKEPKKPLSSVEVYLQHAEDLLGLLCEDKEIYKLCDHHTKRLKMAKQNINILITQFKMHKSQDGELRQSLDYAYVFTQMAKDYKEYALQNDDYKTADVISELDWMVTRYLRGQRKQNETLNKFETLWNNRIIPIKTETKTLVNADSKPCDAQNCCFYKLDNIVKQQRKYPLPNDNDEKDDANNSDISDDCFDKDEPFGEDFFKPNIPEPFHFQD